MIPRKVFVKFFVVCITCIAATSVVEIASAEDSSFYVFAIDKGHRKLESVEVRSIGTKVKLKRGKALALPVKPSGLCLTPNFPRLIVTGRNDRDESTVYAVDVSAAQTNNDSFDSSALKLRGGTTVLHSTGYTSIDRGGRFFLSADYRQGVVAAYQLGGGGVVGKESSVIKLPEKSAHFIYTTPDNRFAYVPCVKDNNAIFQFALDQQSGKLTPLQPFRVKPPAFFGPRHAVYHPSKPIVYFSNEQQLGVSAYQISDDGQLNDIQHATTVARRHPYAKGKRGMHASDIAISHDAQWLFVALRDFEEDQDSVFTFEIGTDGKLSLRQRVKVGDVPWKLSLSSRGDLLLVSTVGDQKLSAYRIQPDGALVKAASLDWDLKVRDMVVIERN